MCVCKYIDYLWKVTQELFSISPSFHFLLNNTITPIHITGLNVREGNITKEVLAVEFLLFFS